MWTTHAASRSSHVCHLLMMTQTLFGKSLRGSHIRSPVCESQVDNGALCEPEAANCLCEVVQDQALGCALIRPKHLPTSLLNPDMEVAHTEPVAADATPRMLRSWPHASST